MLGILKKEISERLAGKSVEKCTFSVSYYFFQEKYICLVKDILYNPRDLIIR